MGDLMSNRERALRALLNRAELSRSGRVPFANVRDPDDPSDSDLEDGDVPLFDAESNASDDDRRTIATTANPPDPLNVTEARSLLMSEIDRMVGEMQAERLAREMAGPSLGFGATASDASDSDFDEIPEAFDEEETGAPDVADASSDSDFDGIPETFDAEDEETGAEHAGVGASRHHAQRAGEHETNIAAEEPRVTVWTRERDNLVQYWNPYRENPLLYLDTDSDYSPSEDSESDDSDSDDFEGDDSDVSFMPELMQVGSSPLSDELAVAPIAVNEDGLPEDLVCSICMSLPLDPVLTPGDYMFCRPCIEKSLKRSRQCPVTRKACSPGQLKPPEGFVKRLWSSVQVKCGHHGKGCAWTGSVADFSSHLGKCSFARPDKTSDHRRLEDLARQLKSAEMANMEAYNKIKEQQEEITAKNRTIRNQTNQINDVTNQVSGLLNRIESMEESHEEQNASLWAELTSARRALSRQSHTQINHTRHFGRDSIVDLSLLVAQNLTRKPRGLDSGRIFNFVRTCYMDLEKDYSDNPYDYRDNVKMLLATCQSCSWFSPRQQDNFEKWFQREFGTWD